MDELDGGGSCTGGSMRIGPSVPIGSGQGASVVTSYTPPRPPQLRHMLCSPMGTASSLSGAEIEGPKFKSSPCTHRTCSALGTTEWRAQHSKMDELDGGSSCTGGSMRIGPSVPSGSGQGASVVTSYTPPRPPQLRHMLCSPMGTASSLSRGRILKGFAPNPSHLLCARHHSMAGPTLENGRAGRRGFLHGWLDENWALCSHRFWSGSIGRYFVHSAEATAAPTPALLTHGDC